MPSVLVAVDLFAGAGGLSLGARASGVDVRVVVDVDPYACETLRLNRVHHGAKVVEKDVRVLSGERLRDLAGPSPHEHLVVMGGAPCQPFSKAAYWTDPGAEARYRRARARGVSVARPPAPSESRPDGRRTLVEEFWRIVTEARADAFLFENVPSILHPRNRPLLERLVRLSRRAGFHVTVFRGRAVEFGTPQRRERVFVLGSRMARPVDPKPTHSDEPVSGLKPFTTAGRALTALGPLPWEREVEVKGRWAEHLRTIPAGWNYKAHTAWGGHPSPTFETETRYWHFLLKLHPDLPSWTIPATPGPWTGPFHWSTRRLLTPELAALQDFPADYVFSGPRRERVRQIGNAIPVRMAAAAVGAIRDTALSGQRAAR